MRRIPGLPPGDVQKLLERTSGRPAAAAAAPLPVPRTRAPPKKPWAAAAAARRGAKGATPPAGAPPGPVAPGGGGAAPMKAETQHLSAKAAGTAPTPVDPNQKMAPRAPTQPLVRRQQVQTVSPSAVMYQSLQRVTTQSVDWIKRAAVDLARALRLPGVVRAVKAHGQSVGWWVFALRIACVLLGVSFTASLVHSVFQRRRITTLSVAVKDLEQQRQELSEEAMLLKRQSESLRLRCVEHLRREQRMEQLLDYRVERMCRHLGQPFRQVVNEIKIEVEELSAGSLSRTEALMLMIFDELEVVHHERSFLETSGNLRPYQTWEAEDLVAGTECTVDDEDKALAVHFARRVLELRKELEGRVIAEPRTGLARRNSCPSLAAAGRAKSGSPFELVTLGDRKSVV